MTSLTKKTATILTTVLIGAAVALSLSLEAGPNLNKNSSNSLSSRFSLDLYKNKQSDGNEQIIALDTDTIPTYDGYIFLGYAWNSSATTPNYIYDSKTNTFAPAFITLSSDNPNRTLYAVWKDPTALSITTMQQMTSEICASMPVNKVYTLTDSRDKKSYRIARLADGYCWMLDDLSYSGSAVIYNGHYYYRSPSSSACPSGWGIPYSATYYYGDSYSDPAYGPFPSGYDTKFSYISMNTNSQNPQWSLSSGSTYYFTTGRFYNSSSDSYRMFTISSSGRVSISLRLIYTDYFDRCGSIRCKTN